MYIFIGIELIKITIIVFNKKILNRTFSQLSYNNHTVVTIWKT